MCTLPKINICQYSSYSVSYCPVDADCIGSKCSLKSTCVLKDQHVLDKLYSLGWISQADCNAAGIVCELVDRLTRVTEIKRSNLGLTGFFPTQIADLDQLRVLELDNNLIEGFIPSELELFTSLSIFNVSFNRLGTDGNFIPTCNVPTCIIGGGSNRVFCPSVDINCESNCKFSCVFRDQPVLNKMHAVGWISEPTW